jgi:hypothetical protein
MNAFFADFPDCDGLATCVFCTVLLGQAEFLKTARHKGLAVRKSTWHLQRSFAHDVVRVERYQAPSKRAFSSRASLVLLVCVEHYRPADVKNRENTGKSAPERDGGSIQRVGHGQRKKLPKFDGEETIENRSAPLRGGEFL